MTEEITRELLVRQTTWEAEGVVSLWLEDSAGEVLPNWAPGAHIDVVLPSELVRQYSLSGDPRDQFAYRIAVLREDAGRGGSREIHTTVLTGRRLTVRGPRNRFPLKPASRYLFIAGGIGITPILPMIREATRRGTPWRLFYGGRHLDSMAFKHELLDLGRDRVLFWPQDQRGMLDVTAIVSDEGHDCPVYCCGPEGLLRAVTARCDHLGRTVHLERFSTEPDDTSIARQRSDSRMPFEVELRRTGRILTVPPNRTLLDVIRDVLPDVPSSCEEGFCGSCETPPASSAVNANAKSRFPKPGPGPTNSPPACAPPSRYPHRPDVDQQSPYPRPEGPTPDPWNPALTRRDSRDPILNRTLTTRSTSRTEINTRGPTDTPATPANDQG